MKRFFIATIILSGFFFVADAKEKKDANGKPKVSPNVVSRIVEDCNDPTSRAILDINNVRTTILGANDMWWDLSSAAYEIPKVLDENLPRKHSLFAGSVWIGGIDADKILKVAAQTYRNSRLGVGFWSGPLVQGDATTDKATCSAYNRHWKVNSRLIDDLRAATEEDPQNPGEFVVKQDFLDANFSQLKDIMEWPGNPDPRWKHDDIQFAPYVDLNDNGVYEPLKGDYPQIRGDQSIWFVTNDKGNVPGSGSESIGIEIQTEAFAYVSNDELNNMTFYGNKLINRSTIRLDSCFMSQFVDPDLGENSDDYLACDVPRGLGICFNGDDTDEEPDGYGSNPPAVGVDFFEGPFSDPFDSVDNDRDCMIDEIDVFGCDSEAKTERCIMSKFMYFDRLNGFPLTDPGNAQEAFNFIIGRWADGIPLTYGGSGRGGMAVSEMAFPEATDQIIGWSTRSDCSNPNPGLDDWSEQTAGNDPGDRRFVQSGGPFTLEPGAVNLVTIGVVWARATSGGPRGSFNQLKRADTKAQALFENCFKTVDGPDAPNLAIVELDQEIIITMFNKKSSNNFGLDYSEIIPEVKALNGGTPAPSPLFDSTYDFQGYLIYQLSSPSGLTELSDLDQARLVFQCDVKDDILQVVNYEVSKEFDNVIFPTIHPEISNNKGVKTTIRITQDSYTGQNLINNRKYYFTVVAYGNNQFQFYNLSTKTGQAIPYKAGRRNVGLYEAIPHKIESEFFGLDLNSSFGDGPDITKLEGIGNGGNALELTKESVDKILQAPYFVEQPVYQGGAGPVNIFVNDPKSLTDVNDFKLSLYSGEPGQDNPIDDDSRWLLTYNGEKDTIHSDTSISVLYEQPIITKNGENLGFSIAVSNTVNPGTIVDDEAVENNGVISGSLTYGDETKEWLAFVEDADGLDTELNWIRGGEQGDENLLGGDPGSDFETLLNGTWSPYRIVRWGTNAPAISGINASQRPLPSLQSLVRRTRSVDIVFTADKSKWSRCVVLESGELETENEDGQLKNRIRVQKSIDKEGNDNSTGPLDVGLGWFPGYAIDLESGERLNVCFGEDSGDPIDNGRDLRWNPTDNNQIAPQQFGGFINQWGGRHYVYVMRTRYDEGKSYQSALTKNYTTTKIPNNLDATLRFFYGEVMWVSMPSLLPGTTLLGTDAKVSLRVTRTYGKGLAVTNPTNFDNPKYLFGMAKLAPTKNSTETAKSALNNVRVVPNPYYAYSDRENTARDYRIVITNLPPVCEVNIYDLSGTLIRTLRKDDGSTILDWNLKNHVNVPIAGGTYIIHVDAGDLGDKVVKWFGVLRPLDLSN